MRTKIPQKTRQEIMYCSALVCAICQQRGAHIHHIDKNNSNNSCDNLVMLCQAHHDEAHTCRELSLNLTPNRIRDLRDQWHQDVEKYRMRVASSSGQRELSHAFLSDSVTWGYINHGRLLQNVSRDFVSDINPELFQRLRRNDVLDDQGIIVRPPDTPAPNSYLRNTVYDWFHYDDSLALHMLFSQIVDRFSESVQPIHMDENNWSRTFIREMLKPGDFIFTNRSQYFRKVYESAENAEVSVRTFRRKIEIRYTVNTRNMYGVSAITVSFSGHQSCASFLQLKSIENQGEVRILQCTPIALGICFSAKLNNLIDG